MARATPAPQTIETIKEAVCANCDGRIVNVIAAGVWWHAGSGLVECPRKNALAADAASINQ